MRTTAVALIVLFAASGAHAGDDTAPARHRMVEKQIRARGVTDKRVLEVMREVPRHLFVPADVRLHAYEDRPLPIGHEQTISQPYIVAIMTQLLAPKPGDKVLEIGTGSGYQAAVLARLAKQVYSIEIVVPLADRARATLAELGYKNVTVIAGDGYRGLPAQAPFDGIIVTAAPPEIPKPLVEQLEIGGRMVLPVGEGDQRLVVLEKTKSGLVKREVLDVRFVPMTGEAQTAP